MAETTTPATAEQLRRTWSPYDRLWAQVTFGPKCWTFNGVKSGKGYGRVSVKRKFVAAHRLVVEQETGLDLTGKVVMHICDNPSCVRPDHLRVGTHRDNVRDMFQKGRQRSPNAEKTHCPQGHAYDEKNTMVLRQGFRRCRECQRAHDKNWRSRVRLATEAPDAK